MLVCVFVAWLQDINCYLFSSCLIAAGAAAIWELKSQLSREEKKTEHFELLLKFQLFAQICLDWRQIVLRGRESGGGRIMFRSFFSFLGEA